MQKTGSDFDSEIDFASRGTDDVVQCMLIGRNFLDILHVKIKPQKLKTKENPSEINNNCILFDKPFFKFSTVVNSILLRKNATLCF